LASAFLLATSPLHAQTGDDDEPSFVSDKDETASAGDTASTPTALAVPSLGGIVFGTTEPGTPSIGVNGMTALGTAAIGTPALGTAAFQGVGHFSLAAGASAAGTTATSSPAGDAKSTPAPPPAVPPPSKDDGAGLRTAGYIAGGVGIAGFVLFVIAGIGAKNAHDKLEDCGTSQCDEATKQSHIEDGKMLQTAANIGLATGLTGLGLGATLIVLGARPNENSAPSTAVNGAIITYGASF
jgi:hypothetical protein